MAQSTLTVRTLCLATVALILACGHAARAMGQQQKPTTDAAPRAVPNSNGKVIRVVPAGSGQTTVATHTAKTSAGAGRSGASKVATFTTKSSSNSGNSVATFSGDKVVRVASSTTSGRRPTYAPKKPHGSRSPKTNEPPVISVRGPGEPAPAAVAAVTPAPVPMTVVVAPKPSEPGPPAATAVPAAETPERSGIRNAFGGLGKSNIMPEPRRTPPILSIQASAAR